MSIVAVIPARLASTRLPGKVLLSRTGRPLIAHVYQAARRARRPDRFVIAADDPAVLHAAHAFGAEAILTSTAHPNGTSRCAEAAALLNLADTDVIVNVQGDEPEMDPALIDAAVDALESTGAEVATCASPFTPDEDPSDPNIVKVVLRKDSTAMYFSRSLIPFPRDAGTSNPVRPLRHVGLYVYRVAFLRAYAALEPTQLEATEMLEQLRVLWHGHRIAAAVLPSDSRGIDTPEQYEAFVRRWKASE